MISCYILIVCHCLSYTMGITRRGSVSIHPSSYIMCGVGKPLCDHKEMARNTVYGSWGQGRSAATMTTCRVWPGPTYTHHALGIPSTSHNSWRNQRHTEWKEMYTNDDRTSHMRQLRGNVTSYIYHTLACARIAQITNVASTIHMLVMMFWMQKAGISTSTREAAISFCKGAAFVSFICVVFIHSSQSYHMRVFVAPQLQVHFVRRGNSDGGDGNRRHTVARMELRRIWPRSSVSWPFAGRWTMKCRWLTTNGMMTDAHKQHDQ